MALKWGFITAKSGADKAGSGGVTRQRSWTVTLLESSLPIDVLLDWDICTVVAIIYCGFRILLALSIY